MELYMPDIKFFRALHYCIHGVHHAYPMDHHRLVFPVLPAIIVWFLFYDFLTLALPACMVNTFTGGITFSYLLYDLSHYYLHHSQPLKAVEYRKKYHMYHHYKDPNNGYGITTSYWDILFGTEFDLTKKKGKDSNAKKVA